ncbi:lipopolysaccharide biosynthesis protein [Dankookia sp. GCM10030260]|uniref:lipopolysaccharide biosynthesis protein n=1 Tax=Dankookia sp. GCM10030260 TaxID=3273390 RepID=UPI0036155750
MFRARWAALPDGLRATLLYAGATGWTKGIGLLLLPLITGLLPAAEFGRLELLSSAAEIAAVLAGAGLVDTLYRFASLPGAEGKLGAARVTGLAIVVTLIGLAGAFAAAPLGALLPLPALPIEVILLGISVALEAAIGVPLAWLRMQNRAAAYAFIVILRGTLHTVLLGLLLWQGFGIAGMLGAGAAASLMAAVVLLAGQARDTGIRMQPAAWRPLLAYGVPLIGSGLASFALGTADRWFLAGSVPAEALGHYALASKLALAMAFLMQPFELWWYPRRLGVWAGADGPRHSARLAGTGAAVTLLAAAVATLAGPVLILAATPPAYHPAAAMVPFVVISLVLQSFGSLFNIGAYIGRTGRMPFLVNSLAGAVAIAAYALLIPRFGIAGAIAATVLAQGVRLVVFAILSQRRARADYPHGAVALLALAIAGAAAIPQFLAPWPAAAAAAPAFVLLGLLAIRLGLLPAPRLPRRGGSVNAKA